MAFSGAMSLRRQFGPSMLRTYQEGFNQDFLRAQKAKSIEKLRSDMVSRNKLRNSSDTNLISDIDSEKKAKNLKIFSTRKQILKNQAINEAQEIAEEDGVKFKNSNPAS